MPAKSKNQRAAAAVAYSAKIGKTSPTKLTGASARMYKSMTTNDLKHLAFTTDDQLSDSISKNLKIVEDILEMSENDTKLYKEFYSKTLKEFNVKSIKELTLSKRNEFLNVLQTWNNVNETSSTGGAEGYLTPNAFSSSGKISKKQKQTAELLGYELVNRDHYKEHKNNVNESFYFKEEDLSPQQKMNLAVRQIRNNLYEVEKLISKTIKLKNETEIGSETYGKRTFSALRRINEKVIKLMVSLQDFK